MKKILILLLVVIVVFVGYQYLPSDTTEIVVDELSVDVSEINKEVLAGTAVLLDVRTELELEEDGYAPNSIHFDVVKIDEGELPDISKDKKIYVYCKSGGRAGRAEEILESNGWKDVVNIGGLVDWEAAGGEVVR